MTKVVVAVDGSAHSKRALDKALELFTSPDAKITLLHVRDQYTARDRDHSTDHMIDRKEESERLSIRLMDEMLADLDEDQRARIDKQSQYRKLEKIKDIDDIADTILKFAENDNADVIVIGSQGINAGKLKTVFVGSVAKSLLNSCCLPILVVK